MPLNRQWNIYEKNTICLKYDSPNNIQMPAGSTVYGRERSDISISWMLSLLLLGIYWGLDYKKFYSIAQETENGVDCTGK